jgi:hypothetical protein
VCERQLNSLADLLLLGVHATDVRVRHIRLLVRADDGDRRVRFGREDVDEGVGVPVERDGGRGLEELAVERAEDADDVVRARRRADDARVLVDRLEELADDERDGLDALDLLRRAHELALQVRLLVLDVRLLDLEQLQVPAQLLVARVQVLLLELAHQVDLLGHDRAKGRLLGTLSTLTSTIAIKCFHGPPSAAQYQSHPWRVVKGSWNGPSRV